MSAKVNSFRTLGYQLPMENWFTNCLAYFIQTDPVLAESLLRKLTGEALTTGKGLELSVVSQHEERNRKADIVANCTTGDPKTDFLVVIENKVNAPFDYRAKGQVKDYLWNKILPRIKSRHGENSKAWLVLLTKEDERTAVRTFIGKELPVVLQDPAKHFRHVLWEDLYEAFSDYRKQNSQEGESLKVSELLQFMEEEGMKPNQPFSVTKEKRTAWLSFGQFHSAAHEALEYSRDEFRQSRKRADLGFGEQISDEFSDSEFHIGYNAKFRRFGVWIHVSDWEDESDGPILGVDVWFWPRKKLYRDTILVREDLRNQLRDCLAKLKSFDQSWDTSLEESDDDEERTKYVAWKYSTLASIVAKFDKFREQKEEVHRFYERALSELSKSGLIEFGRTAR